MEQSKFYIENNAYCMENLPENFRLVKLDAGNEQNRKFRKMFVLPLQYRDLYRALEYISKIDFDNGDEIVNEALFNSALVLTVKCFTNGKNGRQHINPEKIFKKQDGNDRPRETYEAFKKIRDSFIVHDQEDFTKARVGLMIDCEQKEVKDVVAPYINTGFNYKINAQLLARLINIALNAIENDMDKEIEDILSYYEKQDFLEIEKFPELDYEK